MVDPRFHKKSDPLTLGVLAELTGAELSDPSKKDKLIVDLAALDTAGNDHLSFFDNRKYHFQFKTTRAGACFIRPESLADLPQNTVGLVTDHPYRAYAVAAQKFYPEPQSVRFIAPTAFVDASAIVGDDTYIAHGVFIGERAKIGARVKIMPNSVIMNDVEIGDDCIIGANVNISHALIGQRVHIMPGACIGQPGFGFAFDEKGFVTVPQLGRVIIEDDCEIGANTTIDRGAGPDTVIGRSTRIDNLVQVAHNVKIGRYCIIAAQNGISGSTQFGDYVMSGGQAGFAGHLKIGNGSRVAAQSGVMRDLPPKTECMGTPALPMKQFMRQVAQLAKLAGYSGSRTSDEPKKINNNL
jgi:UDP-3-O-[3-hydroxymyristoyl] glucosamine N-acyltransferase